MIITVIIDNEVVVEKTGKEIGMYICKKLLKQALITVAFNNIPTIAFASPLYNSPNYLKSQTVLWWLQLLKPEELVEMMENLDQLPMDVIRVIKTLRSYKTRLL